MQPKSGFWLKQFCTKIFNIVAFAAHLVGFASVVEAKSTSEEALNFVVSGDRNHPLIKDVSMNRCDSVIVVDTIIFGLVSISHDWDQAIWNSKQYVVNSSGKPEVRIQCSKKCASYSGNEGFEELLSLSALLEGIDLSSTVILEIAASPERVDRALEDIRQRCPGIRSRY